MAEVGRVIQLFTPEQTARNARRADETTEGLERAAELGSQICELVDELKHMAAHSDEFVQDAADAVISEVVNRLTGPEA